ncbi:YwdI family protein [Psychrobacillus soli]|uniref:Uracil-DNA glycosylase n=1 Tax=Psychrobacillus soli TaxID=1543965 RepID=A0A544SUB7_9BACI|nr:YwdI family protein [Psychrobacillus soli]TQR08751.1 uracil-DNA glycosylase [Psychrobacillus soli]
MISSEHILMQIDKQLQQAKTTGNEQSKREALAAIRALCDLVLDSVPSASLQAPSVVQVPRVVQAVSVAPTIQQPVALKEDDANGESLFDF